MSASNFAAKMKEAVDRTVRLTAQTVRTASATATKASRVAGSSIKDMFAPGASKLESVRKNLDSTHNKDKLDGMKTLIAMYSKGKNVSELFADVAKNVVCTHIEIKKLVYTYIIHYAEEKQDEALLCINSFQKDLNNQNQLIRAMALRVMSSIRVPIISQLIVLAIKKCASDHSPYVKKCAALAVPKVFCLDAEHQPALIEIISDLLADRSNIVLGSAVQAFAEVCPDRYDLIHPQYRRILHVLPDCDEWSQIVIVNMLLGYARTQFVSPFDMSNPYKFENKFYSDDEGSDSDHQESSAKSRKPQNIVSFDLDPDHRLLLNTVAPLLQSRNVAVILAASAIFYHLAPLSEASRMVKPLVGVLNRGRELSYVILSNIATMSANRPDLFRPQLKDFFINSSEPAFIRSLKLEILTLLAGEDNYAVILREFQQYIKFPMKDFAVEVIRCIGRVANAIPDATEECLRGLLHFITHQDEKIVAESVVVIRYLIQKNPAEYSKSIRKLGRLLETVQVPIARASIIWLLGEYCDRIPTVAPDAFRHLARDFATQDDMVKLQCLNLGAKLFIKCFTDRVSQLFQYVLQLARYDLNYDVRDRARFLRRLLLPEDGSLPRLQSQVTSILFAEKPSPEVQSRFKQLDRFALGSLSHLLGHTVRGYKELPDFAATPSDPSLRKPPTELYGEYNWGNMSGTETAAAGKKSSKKKHGKKGASAPAGDDLESFLESDSADSDASAEFLSDDDRDSSSGSGSEFSGDSDSTSSFSDSDDSRSGSGSGSDSYSDSGSGSDSDRGRHRRRHGRRSGRKSDSDSDSHSDRSRSASPLSSSDDDHPPRRGSGAGRRSHSGSDSEDSASGYHSTSSSHRSKSPAASDRSFFSDSDSDGHSDKETTGHGGKKKPAAVILSKDSDDDSNTNNDDDDNDDGHHSSASSTGSDRRGHRAQRQRKGRRGHRASDSDSDDSDGVAAERSSLRDSILNASSSASAKSTGSAAAAVDSISSPSHSSVSSPTPSNTDDDRSLMMTFSPEGNGDDVMRQLEELPMFDDVASPSSSASASQSSATSPVPLVSPSVSPVPVAAPAPVPVAAPVEQRSFPVVWRALALESSDADASSLTAEYAVIRDWNADASQSFVSLQVAVVNSSDASVDGVTVLGGSVSGGVSVEAVGDNAEGAVVEPNGGRTVFSLHVVVPTEDVASPVPLEIRSAAGALHTGSVTFSVADLVIGASLPIDQFASTMDDIAGSGFESSAQVPAAGRSLEQIEDALLRVVSVSVVDRTATELKCSSKTLDKAEYVLYSLILKDNRVRFRLCGVDFDFCEELFNYLKKRLQQSN